MSYFCEAAIFDVAKYHFLVQKTVIIGLLYFRLKYPRIFQQFEKQNIICNAILLMQHEPTRRGQPAGPSGRVQHQDGR